MFKSKILIVLLILSVISVAFLPVFTFSYLYPAVDRLLIENSEDLAQTIANHFIEYFEVPEDTLRYEHITYDLRDEIFEVMENFSLEKVKLFSATGEILFSTDPKDIGTLNNKDYFKVLVMRGHNFSKLVEKDTKTLEGRTVTKEVIETYVPVRGKESIVGAFEIYLDLTDTRGAHGALVHRTSLIIFSISFILLISLLVSLVLLSRNISAKDKAEKLLQQHHDELENLVKKRTAEVTAVNIQLQEDIHKRIEAENALQVSEKKFRSMVEMASDAIFIADAETGIIVDVNRKGSELIGLDASNLIGHHLSIIHPFDESDLYSRLIESNYSLRLSPNKVLYVQHISGKAIPVDISANIIEFDKGRIVQGIFRDISDRLKFEDELQKTEKLKTASVLAGGIAHDFNNLLTAVLGNISLAKLEAKDDEKIKMRLVETEKAVSRAKDLTRQLLTFAKGSTPVKTVARLDRLVRESAEFVLHGSKVKGEFDISSDLWQAEVDQGQISQVINNLVINASHAMKDGGICSISAQNVLLDGASGLMVDPGRYVKIAIADKGHGIAPETLAKIFDPFFTTKKQGSGLGLSSSYSIIKNHGGEITVESEVGEGTVFYIYLPATEKNVAPDKEEGDIDISGDARILVMDDEEIVREAVTSLLQYLGYDVDTAKEGQEAINMYKTSKELGSPYDAVIMDLTVPGGMGGKEAVKEIKKIEPSLKVIVSSGYYTDPVLANFKDYGFDGVVPKPYQVEELGKVLKEVLTSSAA